MKIKTIKKLNLPQLIEYAWENDVKEATFYAHENRTKRVYFNALGYAEFSDVHQFSSYDTFTFEVEEDLTEDTKLDFLLDHFINPYGQHYAGNIYHNRSINDVLEENDEMEIATNSIHLFNKETKEFKLIWRDGKLI